MNIVVLTDSFDRQELRPVRKQYSPDAVLDAARKTLSSGVSLGQLGYTNGRLVKVRVPHKVSGRMVAFVYATNDVVVPLMLRLKSDKIFGNNLSLDNARAKEALLHALAQAMDDIQCDRFRKLEM